MEITSLPTESLWKFLAFAGLLILTIVPTYLYKLYVQVNQKLIDGETEADIMEEKIKTFEAVFNLHEKQSDRRLAYIEGLHEQVRDADEAEREKVIELKKQIHLNTNELSEALIHSREKYLETGIAHKQLGGTTKLVRFLYNQLEFLRKWAVAAILIGLLMSLFGFYKWYNLQKYVDASVIKGVVK